MKRINFQNKTNHSNRPNGQVLFDFIFSCMSLARATNFLYVVGNLQSALNDGRVLSPSSHLAFNLFSVSQKMPKWLNSVGR